MKSTWYFLIPILLTLQSCFMGADTYEKEVNEYFWLHRNFNSEETFLSTITEEGYRLTDKYLGPIAQIEWNNNYIIIKEIKGNYYIQPIKKSNSVENIKKDLKGPFTKQEFQNHLKNLKISKTLNFKTGN